MDNIYIEKYIGFLWDTGNCDKNQKKHAASQNECEQVFFNQPLLLFEDTKHSIIEKRSYVLGKTDEDRKLFLFLQQGID